MSVSYAETAVREIEEILDFLNLRSPAAASNLRLRLQEVEHRLDSHRFLGQPLSALGQPIRRVVVHPYLLFYRIVGSDVVIVGLRHAARDPASMPGTGEADS